MSVELGGGSTRDQGIADALRAHGHDVFAHLYETIATPLYDYCADVLDDAVAACDVVQDSLVAVDARIAALPGPRRLRVWLYAEARRGCQRKLSGPASVPPGPDQGPAPEQATGPDDLDVALLDEAAPAADGETRSLVAAALARLPGRDREALNLAYRHDMTGPDLAEVLGISPYRARSLLHAAGVRFGQAAAVAAVLRAGPAGCRTLLGVAGPVDPGADRPTARQGERLGRHLGKCQDCARVLGGRSFAPELIGKIPLDPPVGRLALRITRTAIALGSYRVKVAGLPEVAGPPDQPGGRGGGSSVPNGGGRPADGGGPPANAGGPLGNGQRRRMLKAVAVSSAAIAVLAVLGVLVLGHVLAGRPGPPGVKAVSGVQRSPAAGAPTGSPALGPADPGQRHAGSGPGVPALPLVGPTPLGVLPSPSGSSPAPSRTSPGPGRSKSPSPKGSPAPTPPDTTSPAPTTPPPTTPPPTTPPPTPTPSSTTIG
jgi:RNA polymerase sigma factor (sigma-70 family)